MVAFLPAVPYAVAVLGGLGIGAAIMSFFGGEGKKEAAITTGAETHAPYEHYVPIDVHAPVSTYQYDYTVVSDSPFAYVRKTMGTDVVSSPYVAPERSEYDPIGIEQLDEGTDMLKIAAVIGVAYLGGQYLEGRK